MSLELSLKSFIILLHVMSRIQVFGKKKKLDHRKDQKKAESIGGTSLSLSFDLPPIVPLLAPGPFNIVDMIGRTTLRDAFKLF